MPLTYAGRVGEEQPVSADQERARKIKPEFARGELRRVVTARQQAEAEWIQMMLLEEGVPSTLRRTAGFDVPEMLAAGPRDVLVPESGYDLARRLLTESDIDLPSADRDAGPSPVALLVGMAAALAAVAVVIVLLVLLT